MPVFMHRFPYFFVCILSASLVEFVEYRYTTLNTKSLYNSDDTRYLAASKLHRAFTSDNLYKACKYLKTLYLSAFCIYLSAICLHEGLVCMGDGSLEDFCCVFVQLFCIVCI